MPFLEARDYIQNCSVTFRRYVEFREWATSGDKPASIPSRPDVVYASDGWQGYRDFLGYSSRTEALRKPVEISARGALRRDSLRRRSISQNDLLQKLHREIPEFETRRLSARWPCVVLFRPSVRSSEAAEDQDSAEHAWIAVQLKICNADAKRRHRYAQKHVFHHVSRIPSIGVIFASDDASDTTLRRPHDIQGTVRDARRFEVVALHLDAFEARSIKEELEQWWKLFEKKSIAGWTAALGHTSAWFGRHDAAANFVEKALYQPLQLEAEKVFPFDTCKHGNLLLGRRIRCLQRIGRSRKGGCGFMFDADKIWTCGAWRPGGKRESTVAKYICVIVDSEADGTSAAPAGVFILPPEFVFRNGLGGETRSKARFSLYPPFLSPYHARSREKQVEQCKYYVDFRNMGTEEQLRKATALLGI